jgi:tRNA (guanine-N7-)-methyltransferase
MPRRALRKVDPSIELTRQCKTFEELPRPWQPETLFGRQAPLEVEIGSGKGLFLRTAAAARPDVDFLGIEIAVPYARFAAGGLARRGLCNAVVVIGDAALVLSEVLPDASVAAVHVYFPDPWWKRRHKKRRVLQEGLIRDVARVLRPGGMLHLWTDVREYFDTALGLIREVPQFSGPLPVPETPSTGDMDFRTHFERRTRLHGEPVYRAMFCKEEGGHSCLPVEGGHSCLPEKEIP